MGHLAASVGKGRSPQVKWFRVRSSPRHCSFELVQIGVGGRVTQRTAHRNDLAFVMEGMRQDMMKNKRRGADGDVPIGEMKVRISIELLIGQGRQISMG